MNELSEPEIAELEQRLGGHVVSRTSDGRMIRAVRTAHGLASVAAKIVGLAEVAIEERSEASPWMAQQIALKGERWAIRFLLTARGRHRVSDAKHWNDGISDLSEPEIAELEQRLRINFQAPNLPQIYPKLTPRLPQIYPRFTPDLPQICPRFAPDLPRKDSAMTPVPPRDDSVKGCDNSSATAVYVADEDDSQPLLSGILR